ncbi:uncharacterized protein KD926_004835 [Aspergillus affinis]|uniref:uncharacterized protein n=1 Tax=Aspergillus affinis TaxID=1070780 RepID=UPI0022FE7527|nr:uncharacterized protein KD926_004835 [Aspergillus affinis]KAI9035008.1 hypothetical protein KD926_004835 [Aspergillus affinis]
MATITESLPILGYITALAHQLAGNAEQSHRAVSKATGSTVIFTACFLTGLTTGNPWIIGLTAASITPFAIRVERSIQLGISVDNIRTEEDAERFVRDSIINAVSASAGTYLAKYITIHKEAIKQKARETFTSVQQKLAPASQTSGSNALGSMAIDYASGNLVSLGLNEAASSLAWNDRFDRTRDNIHKTLVHSSPAGLGV